MSLKQLLMIPGPTPVPDDVLRALSQPMINHRGPEYIALQNSVVAGLQTAFQTEFPVQIYPASGTGGLEAAVVNSLSPGDGVVACPVGAFGDRFAEIAETMGASVHRVATPWGEPVTCEALTAALAERPETRAVLLTHNETSTGVLNDIEALAAAARSVLPEVLILVDAISGMLAADLQPDAWGLDVVVAGSQKAWMLPPGLTFLGISPRAWEANAKARMPRFYFDFKRMAKSMATGQTPYTPAVSLIYGLEVALGRILGEGLPASFLRHERMARATRAAVEALGLRLFARSRHSPALTSVLPPEGLSARDIRSALRKDHGVVVAGGQGPIKDTIFRIGHLGYVSEADLLGTFSALERVLTAAGHPVEPGSGLSALERELAGGATL